MIDLKHMERLTQQASRIQRGWLFNWLRSWLSWT